MPTCPNCGREAADDAKFCTTCGASLEPGAQPATAPPTAPPQGSPPPPQYYSPPPRQSALPIVLIILAIIVVAVVAIAAIGFWWVTNEANSGNVDMTVNGWSEYTGPNDTAAEGYDRIVLNITMVNDRSYDIPIAWYFFELEVNGTEHRAVYDLQEEFTVPGTVPAGQARTFQVVFDIPEGSDPTKLTYDMYFVDVSADVP